MNDHAPGLNRRKLLALTGAAAATGAFTVTIGSMPTASAADGQIPKRQFRAMWIATVVNIDWPSANGLDAATQKAEYLGWLDLAQKLRLHAVIVQVRPTADAFWPSKFEPWSQYLTGTQGKDPGYDPAALRCRGGAASGLRAGKGGACDACGLVWSSGCVL